MRPVSMVVIGAGSRGAGYAGYASDHPEAAKVVGVAEPRERYRNELAAKHAIPAQCVFSDWREAADLPRFADAAIVATQDAMHADPAVAFASKGYHILLEKPMAPNETDCRRIVDAALRYGIVFAVCHVMRYTRYTRTLKALLDSGAIGDVVSVQHLEPVGYWHQAHSFVRGNWRNEKQSSPMLLAKSCHDLDWLRHIMGCRCLKAASFGSLNHFRREKKPAAAGKAVRCLDCAFESQCAYSAKRIYFGYLKRGHLQWPVNVVAPDPTPETVEAALRDGPYGRCVYECDNDVVDNQVVILSFEGDRSASFTMTAFNESAARKTNIYGTRGELRGDGSVLTRFDFLTDRTEQLDTNASDGTILGGHGGGDEGLMEAFVAAVAANEPSRILSGPLETLESHLMVFAAERSRREGRVVDVAL